MMEYANHSCKTKSHGIPRSFSSALRKLYLALLIIGELIMKIIISKPDNYYFYGIIYFPLNCLEIKIIATKGFQFLSDFYVILHFYRHVIRLGKYICLFRGPVDIATIMLRYIYRAARFITLSAMNNVLRKVERITYLKPIHFFRVNQEGSKSELRYL